MAEINCDLRDFAALFERTEKKRLERAYAGAERGARKALPVLRDAAPKDTGELRDSMSVVRNGRTVILDIDAPHALLVDQGTRPHRPPIAPLIAWCQRHGLPVSVAYAIAAKIEAEGTKPTFFIRNTRQMIEQIILEAMTEALGDR